MQEIDGYLPLKRPHLFSGKLLSSDEFSAEQEYLRERQCRHNRFLHGWGVVAGLIVDQSGDQIVVSPGMALDCAGNEIEVPAAVTLDLPPCEECLYVYLRYNEKEIELFSIQKNDPIPGLYFEEGFQIGYEMENRLMVHARIGPRWQTCGQPHPIPLARMRSLKGRWKIDRRYFKPPRTF